MRVKPQTERGLAGPAVSGIMRGMKRSLIGTLIVVVLVELLAAVQVFAQAPRAATPADQVKVPPGFKVELLRSATEAEGTWVCMAVDDLRKCTLPSQKRKLQPPGCRLRKPLT